MGRWNCSEAERGGREVEKLWLDRRSGSCSSTELQGVDFDQAKVRRQGKEVREVDVFKVTSTNRLLEVLRKDEEARKVYRAISYAVGEGFLARKHSLTYGVGLNKGGQTRRRKSHLFPDRVIATDLFEVLQQRHEKRANAERCAIANNN